jgi:hypothetical protein
MTPTDPDETAPRFVPEAAPADQNTVASEPPPADPNGTVAAPARAPTAPARAATPNRSHRACRKSRGSV